jgi:hypothetical protein
MIRMSVLTMLIIAASAVAQTGGGFDLTWSTIDGGGAMNITGGAFALSGTIGQPDAQSPPGMSGPGAPGFQLTGGFWAVPSCACPGDMNGDTIRNGLDISQFVQCIIVGGSCSCADVDGITGINMSDVAEFVNNLLAFAPCP